MAKVLDRTRDFGEVFGGNDDGHRYEQDGVLFDGAGNEMGTTFGAAVSAKKSKAAAEAVPTADSEVDAQLAAQGLL